MPEHERADLLGALAGLLRSGLPLPSALLAWHSVAPPAGRGALTVVRRRLALGDSALGALGALEPRFGPDGRALRVIVALHLRTGGAADRMVERLARSTRQRATKAGTAASAAAGARLSARLVAGLPLLFAPLAPIAGAPVLDASGLVLISIGLALALAGIAWIERLVPRPPEGDGGAALLADLLGAALRGGAPVSSALEIAAVCPPDAIGAAMLRAARLVRLGCRWSSALQRSPDEGLALIGATLERAEHAGVPLAAGLEECAELLREEAARAFETSLARAPVLMVLPLTIFVLPSLLLLGVAPLIRGLGSAW